MSETPSLPVREDQYGQDNSKGWNPILLCHPVAKLIIQYPPPGLTCMVIFKLYLESWLFLWFSHKIMRTYIDAILNKAHVIIHFIRRHWWRLFPVLLMVNRVEEIQHCNCDYLLWGFLLAYTLSHPENDRDVTERAQIYMLQDASLVHQSRWSFLNTWKNP